MLFMEEQKLGINLTNLYIRPLYMNSYKLLLKQIKEKVNI